MSTKSTMLGKRKDRDEQTQVHGSTIFVSNLPYSATSTDLKTLFSDLGPVRSAFVVTDPSSGSSKGVGYVSFSIREDADLAFEKVNESADGLVLDGRRLRAQWAESKPHKDRREKDAEHDKEAKPAKIPKQSHPSTPRDPLAIRTIVVSGLPPSIDSKGLWKKVRKYRGAEKVDWPVKKGGEDDPTTAHVLFTNPAAAQDAVTKLHAHVFKGSLLSVTLKKRLDGLAKPVKPKPIIPALSGETQNDVQANKGESGPSKVAPSRANRLIVRNIPFNVTEQDLRSVFLPYGPIHSIHIPTSVVESDSKLDASGSSSKPRTKGYAFVWMLSKTDAERAIKGANGMKISAGMADTMVRDKQKKKKLRREEAKLKEKEKERKAKSKGKEKETDGDGNSESEESDEDDAMGNATERIIAVDWALSKDKWEEAKAKMQEDAEIVASGSDAGDHDASDESESQADGLGVHDGGSDSDSGSDDDEMEVDEEDHEPGRPQLPPPETGTTLFVRNVPFEATDDELRTLFRAFGSLRYARVTVDHETGRSRGTGFVCFWNIEDADKVIEQSDILRKETTGGEVVIPKKNPFKLPSLLTPDPSASVSQSLVLQGRTLDVIRAVTRDEAGKLKEAGEKQREKADKRNLYLLREGIILPNTPAAELLSTAEVEKRTQSFNSRRALLRSNPSLYVSKTRLSVRQLPLFATERMLKRFAIHAMRAFESDVKAGSRTPLTQDELAEPEPLEAEDHDEKTGPKGKGKGKSGRDTGVKQAKIVRQQDRVDAVTGKGRSKGYGFLEMVKHADALRVLRWGNNNPIVGKLFAAWWIEELEDLIKAEKKAKKEEGRLERLKEALEQQKQGAQKKGGKGTLILEFSIENVQVVKRRAAYQVEQKAGLGVRGKVGRRDPSAIATDMKEETKGEHPQKKRRTSQPQVQASVKTETGEKLGANLGSIIGRKRKERKGKRH